MGLELPFPIGFTNPTASADKRYGPHADIAAALAATAGTRVKGLTVGIIDSSTGKVVDYWFEAGLADTDLVVKTTNGTTNVVTPEQVTVYVPGQEYPGGNTYVSFSNPASENIQFTTEAIYRAVVDATGEQTPESDPYNPETGTGVWYYEGPQLVVNDRNTALGHVPHIAALKAVAGPKNGDTIEIYQTGGVYRYDAAYPFAESLPIQVKPDGLTASDPGAWILMGVNAITKKTIAQTVPLTATFGTLQYLRSIVWKTLNGHNAIEIRLPVSAISLDNADYIQEYELVLDNSANELVLNFTFSVPGYTFKFLNNSPVNNIGAGKKARFLFRKIKTESLVLVEFQKFDEAITPNIVSNDFLLQYDSTNYGAGDPGTGIIRFANAVPSSATAFIVGKYEHESGNLSHIFAAIPKDAIFYFRCKNDREKWLNFKVTSVAVTATYYQINGSVVGFGTQFANGDILSFRVENWVSVSEKENWNGKLGSYDAVSIDLNQHKSNGHYKIYNTSAASSPGGASIAMAGLLVFADPYQMKCIQVLTDQLGGNLWMRENHSNAWSEWKKLNITDAERTALTNATNHANATDEQKHTSNQIIEQAAHALLSLPENSKMNAVISAIIGFLEGTINTSAINDPNWMVSENRLAMLQKAADGTINMQGSALLVNIFAPPGVDTALTDRSGWTSESKTITGANFNGELGKPGQLRILADGTLCYCQSASPGTSGQTNGSATYKRNRAHDILDPANTQDAAVITALETETGWDVATQTKVLTIPARLGTFRKATGGYWYICYEISGTNSYWWRNGTPPATPLMINASSHPVLTGRLLAHDFSVSLYTVQSGDEATKQGQEFWSAATRKGFRKITTTQFERIDRYGN